MPRASPPGTSPGSRREAEEQWSDSFYFGGGDGRGLAFYARIGRRPNEDVTEGAFGAWLPGQGFLLSFARAAPGAGRRGRPAVVRLPAPARHVGDPLRGRGAPVRTRGAPRHRPRRIPAGARRGRAAVHRLGRPAVVRVRPRRGRRHRPLRAARLDGGHAGRRRASPSARGPGNARPLLGRARLAAGALLALVRDGRGPRQLHRAQQRRAARRRRDCGRLHDARRGDRADRLVRARSPSWTRSWARSAPSPRGRPMRWGARRLSAAARSRSRRCASAATAASRT